MKVFSRKLALAASAAALLVAGGIAAAQAQSGDQFIPALVYRTGPYAPNGIPFANGYADYLNLINERDGGINGVKISFEECETGYDTARGVECYERLKGKGPTGAAAFSPLSTGITFALTEKTPGDKIPLVTMGYGRSESVDGSVFPWSFPLLGTYWDAADILVQYIAGKVGGVDKLKGKKIALVYHDSPFGKEPIPVLQELSKRDGFQLDLIPVTAPGVDQKSAWLQVRQNRPDFVLLWGWGVMNTTAIKEAAAVNYPRDKMFGVWWSAAEPDVLPAEAAAKGYSGAALQHSAGTYAVHADIVKSVYDKGKGAGKKEDVGQVLYNRGMVNAMFVVEGIRTAQAKFGNKPLTGEQVRWGLENLNLTSDYLKKLGMEGMIKPLQVSCADHAGAHLGRIHQWDGKNWVLISDYITANQQFLGPIVKAAATKYAADKKITPGCLQ